MTTPAAMTEATWWTLDTCPRCGGNGTDTLMRCRHCEGAGLVDLDDLDEDDLCWSCGGDGIVDAHDEDPINESPGTFVTCGNCGGSGLARDQVVW